MPPARSPLPGPWTVGVAAAAFALRLVPVLLGGGLTGYGRYDDAVYYAAADALSFGRLPYRDFVFLHPPGIVLVLTPCALLGRLTADGTGWAVARVAFMLVGGLNAALVARIAARWGRRAGIAAGVFYACWLPAVYAEQSTLLEPLGTTALLVALSALLPSEPMSNRRRWIAGVALGASLAFKIWYIAPLLCILAWVFVFRRREVTSVIASAVAAALVLLLPFFVAAPTRMFRMVIRDQLGRTPSTGSRWGRLTSVFGVREWAPGPHVLVDAATAVALVVVLLAAVRCLRRPDSALLALVLCVNVTVLLASPSYFAHYGELTAAPAALVIGVGCGSLLAQAKPAGLRLVPVTGVLVLALVAGLCVLRDSQGVPLAARTLAGAAPAGCVASDDPSILIEMNRLSTDFQLRCTVPVDVTGITYDRLYAPTSRRHNRRWQVFLVRYLTSARSFTMVRPMGDDPSTSTLRTLDSFPLLARSGRVELRGRRSPGPP